MGPLYLTINYPGSKSEALQLGVQLILLYFIRIPLLITETFFYFGGEWWVVGGGWGPTFWFFKSLDNNMVYTLGIYVYIYNYSDKCRKNSCGFNFFIKLKKFSTIFKITMLGWFF